MSESRKPLLIGSFLLSGLFLLVVGTLLLSRDSWFSQPSEYVVYFKGALDGLDVGADVTYRGVKVGSVREIRLSYDRNIKDVVMPVILRIDPRQTTSKRSFDQVLEQLVQRGLRAQLQTPSLLTGKAIVALDMFPDIPGYVREPNEIELPAIPSVPSRIDQAANLLNDLVAEIRELPLLELIDSATQAMRGIERLSRSDDLNNGLHSLAATLANLDRLSQRLDAQLPALLASAQRSSGELDATLGEIRQAAAGLRQTLEQTNALLGDSRRSLGPESELQYQLGSALQELSRASKALQRTAESLEQQPQSLIFGKPKP
ncbi:MlaD family protein [Aquipseudomonas alcaligenes]|uniref:MlaD family protein n=1 Tax=Aquipseudomonas alcaligenes TaxID=43263 RepID=UPI001F40DFBA|nr:MULTISPECIES: MlaD family protein [Pseudomonas]